MLTPLKFALSSTTESVLPTISESRPPIMPAMATGVVPFHIIRVSVSMFLSTPSRVVNCIGSSGVVTTILLILFASNAWVG